MVKVLAENVHCTTPLQQRLLPTLISIFQASPDKVPPGLPAVSTLSIHNTSTIVYIDVHVCKPSNLFVSCKLRYICEMEELWKVHVI